MKSISRKGTKTGGGCVLYIVAILFLLVGSGVFIFLSGLPLWNWSNAQHWDTAPCNILSSSVGSHRSDDGTTYSVDIEYAYVLDGTTYHSDQYNFFSGSSSGRSRKQAIVDQFPAGSERECYVNPANPHEAVLNRDFSMTYLIGCFGLIFVFIALAILIGSLRSRGNRSLSAGGRFQPATPQVATSETITLKRDRSNLFGCGFLLVFAAIWNGIVGTVFFGMLSEGEFSSGDLFPLLFMIPFVLVGLGVIALLVYMFLALFNPRPELTLTPGAIPLGGTATLGWRFDGNPSRISKLTISVCGEEKATYRRGTSSVTDTSVFAKIVLVETEAPVDMAAGEVQFTIPEFTAPSFEASNNKIIWQIKVHGDIRRWPDISKEFPIQVVPLPGAGGTRQPAEFREG